MQERGRRPSRVLDERHGTAVRSPRRAASRRPRRSVRTPAASTRSRASGRRSACASASRIGVPAASASRRSPTPARASRLRSTPARNATGTSAKADEEDVVERAPPRRPRRCRRSAGASSTSITSAPVPSTGPSARRSAPRARRKRIDDDDEDRAEEREREHADDRRRRPSRPSSLSVTAIVLLQSGQSSGRASPRPASCARVPTKTSAYVPTTSQTSRRPSEPARTGMRAADGRTRRRRGCRRARRA